MGRPAREFRCLPRCGPDGSPCVSACELARPSSDEADFAAIQRAVLEIEKRASSLDDIRKSAGTIQSASQKILERVQRTRQSLEKQVALLFDKVSDWINHSNRNG